MTQDKTRKTRSPLIKTLAVISLIASVSAASLIFTPQGQRLVLRIKLALGSFNQRINAIEDLKPHRAEGVPILTEALFDADIRVHIRALETLKELRSQATEATPAILACAGHPERDSTKTISPDAYGIVNGRKIAPLNTSSRHSELVATLVALENSSVLFKAALKGEQYQEQSTLALEALHLLLFFGDKSIPEGFIRDSYARLISAPPKEAENITAILRRIHRAYPNKHREEISDETIQFARGLTSADPRLRSWTLKQVRELPLSTDLLPQLAPLILDFISLLSKKSKLEAIKAAELLVSLAPKDPDLKSLLKRVTDKPPGLQARDLIKELRAKFQSP